MKRLLLLSLLLAACSHTAGSDTAHPADASQSEINMAEYMDISVEELRKQTPEEHMEMMRELSKPAANEEPKTCEGSGCSCNIAQKPNAPKRGGCGCGNTACNKAS
ncbi:MAG: hypothetical protein HOG89_04775 [Candidatus Peribacter sp.]|jgi:hypothetical protein|nr:hypothetical protein [Candidatus Peribacter sp.]MBT4393505.1 hypothetical protein [Candidatus Peribacter sp.]MBT4601278.1 hypothetical protein [Candidatus Peribacter sp.]MBT5149327.1 hypothetical protein [Candidatus Peribacter sp.]MBT5638245.1 hypothetical protein [Candidatus Peribacter sp.]